MREAHHCFLDLDCFLKNTIVVQLLRKSKRSEDGPTRSIRVLACLNLPIHCLNYLQSEPMSKIPGKRTLIAANVQNSQKETLAAANVCRFVKTDIGRSQCPKM